MSISGKAWCELWHSSHNEILTPLSWCPSSGYFKNHWGLELFLKCHQQSQNVYFFYLGPIISLNIHVYSYPGSYFITRGKRIWFDFSGYGHFTSWDSFWINFSTRDDVIGIIFHEVGIPLRHWYRDLYQVMELVGSLVSGLLTRFYLLY